MQAASTPPRSQGQITTVNGMQMYYEDHGEGYPLVLLHWFTGSSAVWQPYIQDFSKHFRLIVPDIRGHGRSTNSTDEFTHQQSALDIFALLDQLAVTHFKAIGVSYGGDMLLHMATQQPTRVEAMILVGARSYYPEQLRAICRQSTVDGWDWDELRQHHVHGDAQIRTLLEHFHNLKDSYSDMNFTPPYLSTIRTKTLIVSGDRDPFYSLSMPVEMYTAIPNAYLWIVPNGDHIPIRGDRAQLFTQTALEFLQGGWK